MITTTISCPLGTSPYYALSDAAYYVWVQPKWPFPQKPLSPLPQVPMPQPRAPFAGHNRSMRSPDEMPLLPDKAIWSQQKVTG